VQFEQAKWQPQRAQAQRLGRASQQQRRGFSLVETSISVMLVGVLMVAALQSMGAAKRREGDTVDRLLGQQLASGLLNEILLQAYREPEADEASIFGPEPGEVTGNRALYDDVDDYIAWSASPPKDRSGNQLAGCAGWTRSVSVVWADPNTLGVTASTNTGLKKITVTASKNGAVLGSVSAYRSAGWADSLPAPTDATGNHAPTAVLVASNLNRKVGQTVDLAAGTSSDQDGDYLSYVWSFGDGTTATGASVSHSYLLPGNYLCTLTVYDGRGGIGVATVTARISP
jgi:prepilin-type N-terminal cleavage/methylation domain-containing protein